MTKEFYPVIFHPEDKGYSTFVVDIDGCFSQGETISEAVEMTQDAIGLMLEDYIQNKKNLPLPSSPEIKTLETNDFIVMVEFDTAKYLEKHNNKPVKKTLSIPSWLNILAKQHNINFSKLLQNALRRELNV